MKKNHRLLRFLGIKIYERKVIANIETQYLFYLPVRKTVHDTTGFRRYFLGWCYRRQFEEKKWRLMPPTYPASKYVHLKYKQPKECLIVLGPAIGDYIFSRNYIEELRKSEKYNQHRLVLLCDSSWEQFARYLDNRLIDQFISYNEHISCTGKPDITQAERICKQLKKNGLKEYYDTILLPSMCFGNISLQPVHEHILSSVVSRERIGFYFMLRKEPAAQKAHYTQIVPTYCNLHSDNIFEHLRLYFETILEKQITLKAPRIAPSLVQVPVENTKPYIVIQPFISSEFRGDKMWNIRNWETLVLKLHELVNVDFTLLCVKNEKKDADYFQNIMKLEGVKIKIMAGLDVPELLSVINGALLYIGLDTGLFHIAACLGKKSICISSGRTVRLFLSHYMSDENVRIILPRGFSTWYNNLPDNVKIGWPSNTYVVNAITPNQVLQELKEVLR